MHEKEAEVTAARREAIRLIESYLRDSPHSREQAEALYKLAELYWEESKAVYLEKMGRYQAAVTACHADHARVPAGAAPAAHRRSVAGAGGLPATSSRAYPHFRKIDTVIYLYAFSLRDQGKIGEAVKYFQIILDKYPRSRYIADAWMAIAEYRFYEQQNYKSVARGVREGARAPEVAALRPGAVQDRLVLLEARRHQQERAMRFKDVLDLAKKKAGRTEAEQKRAAELQGQALDYLVELFTEDDTKSAHDAFEFLAQIGGKQYSRKVLQAAGRHGLRPDALRARHRGLPPAHRARSQTPATRPTTTADRRVLPAAGRREDRGRRDAQAGRQLRRAQPLGRRQQGSPQGRRARAHAGRGADPQRRQDDARRGAAEREDDQGRRQGPLRARRRGLRVLPGELPRRARRRRAPLPARRHPLLQARQVRGGGREYLAVGKYAAGRQVPQGRAAAGDGRVREGAQAGRRRRRQARDHRERSPVRRGGRPLRHAVPEGQGDRHRHLQERPVLLRLRRLRRGGQALRPDRRALPRRSERGRGRRPHPRGAQQGQGLREHRELGAAPQEDQGLRVAGRAGAPRQADRRRGHEVGREVRGRREVRQGRRVLPARRRRSTRRTPLAPKALNNAGAVLEKAKKPEEAVAAYKELADKYPSASEAPDALFTAARIEESVAYYDKAAALYEQLASKYPQNPHAADALRSAGVLRQSLGQHDRAIKHYGEYARRYKDRADAKDVAFQAAVVREEQKDWRGAAASFAAYSKTYPGDARTVEALAREADAHLKAGNDAAAKEPPPRRWPPTRAAASTARRRVLAARRPATTPPRRATSRASSSSATTSGSRSPASRKQLAKVLEEKAKRLEEAKGDLPRRRHLQVARVGDGGAAAHRPGLRGLRQGDAQRARAQGSQRGREAGLPRRAREGRRRHRGQGPRRLQVRLREGAARSASTTSTRRRSGRRCRAWPRTSTRRRPSCASSTRLGEPRVALERIEEVRRDQ